MYETFEHTADLGLRVRAPDLDQLFVEAAQALLSAIVDDLTAVEPKQRIDVSLQGDDWGFLLFDWLNELLYRFDSEHLLFGKFEVRISSEPGASATGSSSLIVGALKDTPSHNVVASAWGETLDRSRHSLAHEVKAITYHGLRVEKEGDGWLAEVIVDI
jgi:SHS2 domain-containing protein